MNLKEYIKSIEEDIEIIKKEDVDNGLGCCDFRELEVLQNILKSLNKIASQKKTVWIGISENDLDEFKGELVFGNEVIKWAYNIEETNELIDVHFVSEDELNQREQ